MQKLKSTFPNMVIVLTATTVIAGFLLGFFYSFTSYARAEAKQATLIAALKKVVPDFDNDPIKEQYAITLDDKTGGIIYPASKDGKPIGAAVEATSSDGFSGDITIVVGFDIEGNIIGYEVTQHNETPGLGAKMNDWFRSGKRNIIGKNPSTKILTVKKDGGDIDGITAATISSRAFLDAVNTAATVFKSSYATASISH